MEDQTRSPVSVELIGCSVAIKFAQSAAVTKSYSRLNDEVNPGNVKVQDFKSIVSRISAHIAGGSMFAILGGSGSGKTTLLNVIAGRYDRNAFHVEGAIRFQGQSTCGIGYVTQHDYLLPFLTVRETLMFAARLRMTENSTQATSLISSLICNNDANIKKCHEVVEAIILDLGLKECAETNIGDDNITSKKRGISGGEKRRVSVAVQIITDPQVLCADEPTSGLDSFTANTVAESLLRLARGPRRTTIICSIHQPRADVFFLFDSVLLLSRGGHTVYCGPVAAMVRYFNSLGHPCPSDSNPADFFVDLSSVDPRTQASEQEGQERVKRLIDEAAVRLGPSGRFNFDTCDGVNVKSNHEAGAAKGAAAMATTTHSSPSTELTSDVESAPAVPLDVTAAIARDEPTVQGKPPSWFSQVGTLTERFFVNNYRDSSNIYGGLFQALAMGIVIMGIFWQLSDSTMESIRSRYGMMYIVISAEPYILMIILVERFCTEIRVCDRELQDNMYTPSAYMAAHFLSSIPQLLVQPLLFALPVYYGCRLRSGGVHEFTFLAVNIMLTFIINGLSWMCVAINREFSVASLIANSQFTFIGLTSGFLVNFHDLPIYVKWVKNISFHSYAYRILMSNEFSDRVFPGCPSPGPEGCMQYDGNSILKSEKVLVNDYEVTWPVLFGICIAYHLIAFLLLHFVRHPPSGSVSEGSEGEEGEADFAEGSTSSLTDPSLASANDVNASLESETQAVQAAQIMPVSIIVSNISLHVSVASPLVPALSGGAGESTKVASAAGGTKRILDNICATISPGRLVALMGGSGSGKTTLLNLIAGRVPVKPIEGLINGASSSRVFGSSGQYYGSGSILFNGKVPSGRQLRQAIGYVQQFDFHLPSLTVRETLRFNALIRLPRSLSLVEKHARVERVIVLLGLRLCSNIRVGGDVIKGISGGEKRRLSLGIQMLADPPVCLLDEPTTGLDSFTARHVVETLQELAHKGRTVVLSIHQPRYDVFALLDDVILLSRGQQVWSGSCKDMLRHLGSLGYPCPALTNPADFILDISSVDLRDPAKEADSRVRVVQLCEAYAALKPLTTESVEATAFSSTMEALENNDCFTASDSIGAGSGAVPAVSTSGMCGGTNSEREGGLTQLEQGDHPLYFTLPILVQRCYLNQKRQPALMSTRVSQGLFFALILSCFYAPVGNDQNSIQNRIGNLYMITSLSFIGMLNNIAIFPQERNVFYREYVDGGYSVSAFFLSYFILALPFLMVSGALLAVLLTFAIGLRQTGEAFILFTYVMFCFMFVGECIGVAFCALFYHIGFSVNIMSVFISFFCMMAGFISIDMSETITRINYISPLKWGSWIVTNVVFRGINFTCQDSERLQNGDCHIMTGEQVLALYHMNETGPNGGMGYHVWLLGVLSVAFFIISFLVLRLKAYQLSH